MGVFQGYGTLKTFERIWFQIENWIDAEVTKLFNGNDNNVSFEILLVLFESFGS